MNLQSSVLRPLSSVLPSPLDGIRILDLTRVLAGPYCTMLLGDLGADVVKIEAPGRGDDTRHWGPPFVGGESAYYLCVNRNKRSVTVNLKTEAGREIVRRLALQADVLAENFKVGSLAEWGLDYASLSVVNPRLVYLSITGYGQTGPWRDRPGYDLVIQAEGGVMAITGPEDGPPYKVGVAIADITTGMMAAQAVLAALFHRERTGQGQWIDLALYDTHLAWLANVASSHLVTGEPALRYGNAHQSLVPYEVFPTADGYLALGVGNDRQFSRLCDLVGHAEWATDPRFLTNPDRVAHRGDLIPLLQAALRQGSTATWLAALEQADIPAGKVNSVAEALSAPTVAAREMVVEVPHPTAGSVRLVGSPLKFSAAPTTLRRHPPLLGEHTDAVLADMGYPPEYIESLRLAGVI
ncbi:MAG: CoA transferase [Anaerolineae bacterium]|nr:CoA transferase [Anaerolineae bacterium]